MRPVSNKRLPGADLTALGLQGGTLIVFFFRPAMFHCSDAQKGPRTDKNNNTHKHKHIHVVRYYREQGNLLVEDDTKREVSYFYNVNVLFLKVYLLKIMLIIYIYRGGAKSNKTIIIFYCNLKVTCTVKPFYNDVFTVSFCIMILFHFTLLYLIMFIGLQRGSYPFQTNLRGL